MKIFFKILLVFISSINIILAQDDDSSPYVKGSVKLGLDLKNAGPNIEIKATQIIRRIGKKALEEVDYITTKTDKKGQYEFKIEYGKEYRVYCYKQNYIPVFYDIITTVPSNFKEPTFGPGTGAESIMLTEKELESTPLNAEYVKLYPFTVIILNTKDLDFKDDQLYIDQYKSGKYKDREWENEEKRMALVKKEEEQKQKVLKDVERKNRKHAISAKLTLKGNAALSKTKVFLFKENPSLNPSAQPIETAVTNAFGKFTFTQLQEDQNYFVGIEGVDETLAPNVKINNKHGHTALSQDSPTVVSLPNGKLGVISFTASKEFLSNFEVLSKTILVAGNVLLGDKDKLPLHDVKLLLKDATDKIIQTTRTNTLGGFAFSNVDPDQKYSIDVEHNSPSQIANKRVSIVNKAGQEVFSSLADANGKFKFEILTEDKFQLQLLETDDTELNISLKGKIYTNLKDKTPLKNSKIYLSSQVGKSLVNVTTDENGNFSFDNISADIAYLINLDENDPNLKTVTKVYLENEDGSWIREITKDNLNKFTFQLISSEVNKLHHIEIMDPWLDIIKNRSTATSIAEPIYFKAGDDRILNEAATVLDKVALIMRAKISLKIEVESHTDATGSDTFNMELSRKRAKSAVDYLVSKGVNPNNLKEIGYGETKLKNNCGNNVKCSEAEHTQNRRIEFKILSQ
jgi:outer membrane protein OmpA-like peptidoglycan-associated protein